MPAQTVAVRCKASPEEEFSVWDLSRNSYIGLTSEVVPIQRRRLVADFVRAYGAAEATVMADEGVWQARVIDPEVDNPAPSVRVHDGEEPRTFVVRYHVDRPSYTHTDVTVSTADRDNRSDRAVAELLAHFPGTIVGIWVSRVGGRATTVIEPELMAKSTRPESVTLQLTYAQAMILWRMSKLCEESGSWAGEGPRLADVVEGACPSAAADAGEWSRSNSVAGAAKWLADQTPERRYRKG